MGSLGFSSELSLSPVAQLDSYPETELDEFVPENRVPKKKSQVFLEGYVETKDQDELGRSKSLTDEDLEELKGCLDLGFGFSYEEIPELCNTLPALELCYSLSQKFLDDQQQQQQDSLPPPESPTPPCGPLASWKISSPGEFLSTLFALLISQCGFLPSFWTYKSAYP